MKNPILRLVLLAIALMMAACTTPPASPPETRNIFIEPSTALTQNCSISTPPNKEEFLKADDEKMKSLLYKYNLDLISDLKKCNVQWASIRDWIAKQKAIYEKEKK